MCLRHVAADLEYFSLLRPLSELAVARQFAKPEQYDAHFSSCNRNFHILGERPAQRWCGRCPKCHFVFLALAPFMPKPRLTASSAATCSTMPSLAGGFDALLEYQAHKPFECVGEGRESRAAMAALAQRPSGARTRSWRGSPARSCPRSIRASWRMEPLLVAAGEHAHPGPLWRSAARCGFLSSKAAASRSGARAAKAAPRGAAARASAAAGDHGVLPGDEVAAARAFADAMRRCSDRRRTPRRCAASMWW